MLPTHIISIRAIIFATTCSLSAYQQALQQCGCEFVAMLRRHVTRGAASSAGSGAEIEMLSAAGRLTMEVVGRCAYG